MRKYAAELKDTFKVQDKKLHYFQLEQKPHFFKKLEEVCKNSKIQEISLFEVEDKFFEKELIS